ncbi:MAG TPA: hypothetical protein VKG92_07005 [Flavobacteriales bacterium]|nr:hypothetical protein [Flavobacteriales bacterium]
MKSRSFPAVLMVLLLPLALPAQDDCATLSIASIHYSPFTDTIVEVRVLNSASFGFNEPSLVLYDGNGDTLAWSYWDFFVIGPDQTFLLPLAADANVPVGFFDATVEVWTYSNSTLACTLYPPYTNLCPSGPCAAVYPSVIGAPSGHQVDWNVTDAEGDTVATGTMVVPAGGSQTRDTLCLPPGAYSLGMEDVTGIAQGASFYMLGSQWWAAPTSPHVLLESGGVSSFVFYEACITDQNSIPEIDPDVMDVSIVNGQLRVSRPNGTSLRQVQLMDTAGRLLRTASGNGTVFIVNIADLPPGVLMVTATDAAGMHSARSIAWTP